MRHPFDGLITPAPQTRRSWLAATLAALGGLWFASRAAAAAPPARAAADPNPEPKPKKKLTESLREDGALTKARGEQGVMTRALNENGGPRVTTLALNEEGARK